MIRTVASCPFCADGVVAFDDRLEIVFNPETAKNTPCNHLGFFWVSLSGRDNWDWGLYWERGQGLGPVKTNDLVTELVIDLTLEFGAHADLPKVACVVVGGTAMDREDKKHDAGEIWVYPPGGSPELALFDGFALYAYNPAALVAAVHATGAKHSNECIAVTGWLQQFTTLGRSPSPRLSSA